MVWAVYLFGVGTGVFATIVVVLSLGGPAKRELPPATARAIGRARRASRARLPAERIGTPVGLHTFDDHRETL